MLVKHVGKCGRNTMCYSRLGAMLLVLIDERT